MTCDVHSANYASYIVLTLEKGLMNLYLSLTDLEISFIIVVPGYWYGGDWFSLSLSCVAKGENLVGTWLDFA